MTPIATVAGVIVATAPVATRAPPPEAKPVHATVAASSRPVDAIDCLRTLRVSPRIPAPAVALSLHGPSHLP